MCKKVPQLGKFFWIHLSCLTMKIHCTCCPQKHWYRSSTQLSVYLLKLYSHFMSYCKWIWIFDIYHIFLQGNVNPIWKNGTFEIFLLDYHFEERGQIHRFCPLCIIYKLINSRFGCAQIFSKFGTWWQKALYCWF